MKKPFIFLLIILLLSLFVHRLFTKNVKEGYEGYEGPSVIQVDVKREGGAHQNNLVYQNAGKIKQQEKTITDFQSSMENEIKDLSDRVTAFQKVIRTNATDISNNAIAIRSTTREINSSAKAKQASMNKAAGDMDTKK